MTTMELEPAVVERGRTLLKKKEATLSDVALAVTQDVTEVKDPKPFPAVPKGRTLTEAVRNVLKSVPQVFGSVQMETRRTLSEAELEQVYTEHAVLDTVCKTLKARVEDIKEIVRTHMDVDAEERNLARAKEVHRGGKLAAEATPRDSKGHFLLAQETGHPYRIPIPGTDKEYSLEYRAGKVTLDGDALLGMFERGEISREEYLGFTRETRVLDETRATNFIKRNPERGMDILAKITHQEPPSTSLYIRKA